MLTCEGYKMFKGKMRIRNAITKTVVEIIEGTWLYKPKYNCWYCNGRSFPAECCEICIDNT